MALSVPCEGVAKALPGDDGQSEAQRPENHTWGPIWSIEDSCNTSDGCNARWGDRRGAANLGLQGWRMGYASDYDDRTSFGDSSGASKERLSARLRPIAHGHFGKVGLRSADWSRISLRRFGASAPPCSWRTLDRDCFVFR